MKKSYFFFIDIDLLIKYLSLPFNLNIFQKTFALIITLLFTTTISSTVAVTTTAHHHTMRCTH